MQQEKSDVELFYDAVAKKFGVTRQFSELNAVEVQMLCQGVNLILQVFRN